MGLKEKLAKAGSTVAFKCKSARPEIKLAIGIAAVIGGTVLACRGAVKSVEDFEDLRSQIDELHEQKDALDKGLYSHQLAGLYKHGVFTWIRHFGAPTLIEAVGILAICSSHGEMRSRLVEAIAMFEATSSQFARYRGNVIAVEGEEKDAMYMDGIRMEKIKEGNKNVQVPVPIETRGLPGNYELAFYLDSKSWPNWINGANLDLMMMQVRNVLAEEEGHREIHKFRFVYQILSRLQYRYYDTEYFDERVNYLGWINEPLIGKHEVSEGLPYNYSVEPFKSFDRDTGEWYEAIKLTLWPEKNILGEVTKLKLPKLSAPAILKRS